MTFNFKTHEYSPGWFMWECGCGRSRFQLRSRAEASKGVTAHQQTEHGVETVEFAEMRASAVSAEDTPEARAEKTKET